jgi:hypothetical protein
VVEDKITLGTNNTQDGELVRTLKIHGAAHRKFEAVRRGRCQNSDTPGQSKFDRKPDTPDAPLDRPSRIKFTYSASRS